MHNSFYSEPMFILFIFILSIIFISIKKTFVHFIGFTLLGLLFILPVYCSFITGASDGELKIGGSIPFSDASDYYSSAIKINYGQKMGNLSSRRPMMSSFLSTILFFTGLNLQYALLLISFTIFIVFYLFITQVNCFLGKIGSGWIVLVLYVFIVRFLGTTMSENLGIIWGILGFILLLSSVNFPDIKVYLIGIFVLFLGMQTRVGTVFLIPCLFLAGLVIFRRIKYSYRYIFWGGVLIVIIVYSLNKLLLLYLGSVEPSLPFGNFSLTLYGILHQGDWTLAYTEIPIGELSERDYFIKVYKIVLDIIIKDPTLLMKGILLTYKEFFISNYMFSFLPDFRIFSVNYKSFLSILSLLGIMPFLTQRKNFNLDVFLKISTIGVIISVPFLPPADADSMRVYAVSLPLVIILPFYGFQKIIEIKIIRRNLIVYKKYLLSKYINQVSIYVGNKLIIVVSLILFIIVLGSIPVSFFSKKVVANNLSCSNGKHAALNIPELGNFKFISETDVIKDSMHLINISKFRNNQIRYNNHLYSEFYNYLISIPPERIIYWDWFHGAFVVSANVNRNGDFFVCAKYKNIKYVDVLEID